MEQNETTIKKVIRQAQKLCPKEILLLINGSRDRSLDIALSHTITSIVYPFALGQDMWRAIGAGEATGEVWLFLAGDRVILAEDLQPFVLACYDGVDIALPKGRSDVYHAQTDDDVVNLAKRFLNRLLEQQTLGFSSMVDLPFAMTREAASGIGVNHLLIPPLAHAIAIEKGMRIERPHMVKEGLPSKKRKEDAKIRKQKMLTIIGDHLEALAYVQAKKAVDS